MAALDKTVVKVGVILAVFAIIATALVALTENTTHDKIKANEREALLKAINVLVPHNQYNNNILADTITIPPTDALGTQEKTTVYRARKDGEPVAVVLTVVAPDGYSGSITMLVGVNYDGTLAGVRVINQNETPGLGDKIDANKSNWVFAFTGLSLKNPDEDQWKVKKDGGYFDQFTGATITPRAVVKAVKNSLEYFGKHRDELFKQMEKQS